jgi:hypothetical protein
MFIDFEGIDGCGKGTQVERAVGYLRQAFSKATSLKYPDRTTPIGKLIDAYLKGRSPSIGGHVQTAWSVGTLSSPQTTPSPCRACSGPTVWSASTSCRSC